MIDRGAPGADGAAAPRRAPLLITAELPQGLHDWANGLRRAHYPPERNRLPAHVTLFHALPPSAEGEVRRLLGDMARRRAPEAQVIGLMDLGQGTAFALDSPGMVDIHAELAERLHGLIQQRDDRDLRLHITIQNKVPRAQAQALQQVLAASFVPRSFRFHGLALAHWRDELWQQAQFYAFRG